MNIEASMHFLSSEHHLLERLDYATFILHQATSMFSRLEFKNLIILQ